MIIVDTSVWVDHFRRREPALIALITGGEIALHPYTYGELLLGGLPVGSEISEMLLELLSVPIASVSETATFISWARLVGTGIGYVDTHLLVSARLMPRGRVLTRDKNLLAQTTRFDVAYIN